MCASISENALYFVQKDGWTPKKAYKYDIDNNLVTELVSDPNGYMFYGAGLTVNPKNGYVYATLIKGYGQDALSNTIIIVNGETKPSIIPAASGSRLRLYSNKNYITKTKQRNCLKFYSNHEKKYNINSYNYFVPIMLR